MFAAEHDFLTKHLVYVDVFQAVSPKFLFSLLCIGRPINRVSPYMV